MCFSSDCDSDITNGNLRHDVIAEAELDGGHSDVAAALESWRSCRKKNLPTVSQVNGDSPDGAWSLPALLGNERRT